jgi:hypothetical protein
VRTRIVTTISAGLLALSLLPGPVGAQTLPGDPVPASTNLESIGRLAEGAGAISMEFSSDTPHMYLSTLKGVQIYDISDPAVPSLVGFEALPHYQNEAMSLGERKNGDKFVLIASGLAGASTTGDVGTSSRFVWVVDVTDPANPEVTGSTQTDSRTHTVSCLTKECEYAYSDGRSQGFISIIDLRDLTAPKMAGTYESVVPQGHDQDLDAAGVLWHVGGQGAVALDVSKPTKPVPLNSTNAAGVGTPDREGNPYNNFILHNSARPNAKAFKAGAAPSLKAGNILLATEEDTGAGECGPDLGGFSTWHIPYLDAGKYKKANPKLNMGGGSVAPLDMWYPEDLAVGANCSAHYFDYNEDGFVTQGWYELGTRVLDVRNPKNIKQVGFFYGQGMEAWASYWVPERDAKGKATGGSSDIVYTADAARGVDILRFTPPGKSSRNTRPIEAPDLDFVPLADFASLPSKKYGYLCRLAVER